METDFEIGSMLMNYDFRKKVYDNLMSNRIILDYYVQLSDEYKQKFKMQRNINNKISRLSDCNKYWELDKYEKLNIKHFQGTDTCKDKFCLNCKKWRQAQRTKKFMPELAKYDKDLYFITYTVPNVDSSDVKATIKKIFEAHRRLIRYFDGSRKTKLTDFDDFNFIGGLRVLEISINRARKEKYHVHIHCAYILKDFKLSKPQYQNAFSIDHSGKRDYVRKFTIEEIKLQKFWFLVYEGINLKNCYSLNIYKEFIEKMGRFKDFENRGYSVTIDKFKPGQYSEMFKYMIKDYAVYKDDKGEINKDIIAYDEFKTLYFATANVRQLEAYGVLKKIEDEDFIDKDEVEESFNKFIEFLNTQELPVALIETPEETLNNNFLYISKSKYFTYYRKLQLEEQFEDKDIIKVDNKLDLEEYRYYKFIIQSCIDDEKKKEIISRYKEKTIQSNRIVEVVDI